MTAPEPSEGQPHPQGLIERQAAFRVHGGDMDQRASAALRQWVPVDDARLLAQRPGLDGTIRPLHRDLDALCLACRRAHQVVDAAGQQAPRRRRPLEALTRRDARPPGVMGRDIQLALHPGQAQADLAQPRTLP